MSYQIEGKLHKKFPTEVKSEKFQIRDFVIETHGRYPQLIKFQLSQDRCDAMDNFTEGEAMVVHFDLRGREWEGKYYTNLNAWRIEKRVSSPDNLPPKSETMQPVATSPNDDLPF